MTFREPFSTNVTPDEVPSTLLVVVCGSVEKAGVPSAVVCEVFWILLPVLFDCVEKADGCLMPM